MPMDLSSSPAKTGLEKLSGRSDGKTGARTSRVWRQEPRERRDSFPMSLAPASLSVEATEVHLSAHAIDRFHERVRPALERPAAAAELERLAEVGAIVRDEPDWLHASPDAGGEAYLLLCEDIVLPLTWSRFRGQWVARTCIARGGNSEKARVRRNSRACGRRTARRMGRKR